MTTSHWLPTAVATIAGGRLPEAPPITGSTALLADVDLWDYWPVQEIDGGVARIGGGTLYMFLAAPVHDDPDARHARAFIRLMHHGASGWRDLGPAFPDGFAPGSRQWSGSAIVDARHSRLTLFFTAAGVAGEAALSYEQALFVTEATLNDAMPPVIGDWTPPVEIAVPDGVHYVREMSGGGGLGTIKAFRDPAFFRDPADGADYIVFTASIAESASAWNGAVGVARKYDGGWTLLPPLIAADGVNNELERPHVVVHGCRYYCFWSTQAKVFADGGPTGPTGLYGMVADTFAGPWRPVNRSGLVIANPAVFPHQAYSWLVQNDLDVLSFVDFAGLACPPADTGEARRHFGGTPAPVLRLCLDGDCAVLA